MFDELANDLFRAHVSQVRNQSKLFPATASPDIHSEMMFQARVISSPWHVIPLSSFTQPTSPTNDHASHASDNELLLYRPSKPVGSTWSERKGGLGLLIRSAMYWTVRRPKPLLCEAAWTMQWVNSGSCHLL